MIDPHTDLLYNIIHYTISQLQDVSPLNYNQESCTFSIYDPVNCKSQETLDQISKTLLQIKKIDYLYPLSDPKSVYVDQTPVLEDGVFRYNPISVIPTESDELWDKMKQKINTLSTSKKSRSLKYTLN